MLEVVLLLYLTQAQYSGASYPSSSRRAQQMEQPTSRFRVDAEESSGSPDPRRQEVAYEQREFAKRFNGLLTTLFDFASSYNAGHVIDAKKAKAVRKALRELEKSDWFRPVKGD
jgi:hypothetical protein